MRLLMSILLISCSIINSQVVDKVLISGVPGNEQHDENVKQAFLLGYSSYSGTQYTGSIKLYAGVLSASFAYAEDNNYPMIIRSTTGLSTGIYYANQYPNIKLVMPSGSNSFVLTYKGEISTCPVIVTGAGYTENQTGYKIDFFSIDPITSNNYSSYSNGYVAGQLAFIANTLNCSIESARSIAREKGTMNGSWDYYNGYGQVNIQSILEGPLPVELTNFSFDINESSINLLWTTATETNNYGFEIERISENAGLEKVWNKIGFIEGNGTSNIEHNYSYVDDKPSFGITKYRLKQIDNDGTVHYSDELVVSFQPLNDYELKQNYPNPFNPVTTIEYHLPKETLVKIKVYDMLGKQAAELVNEVQTAGMHQTKLYGTNLTSGTYIYSMATEDQVFIKKLLLLK